MVKDVLGPRDGPLERLSSFQNPLNEYLTGVLIPVKQYIDVLEEKEFQDELVGEEGHDEVEDTSDQMIGEAPVASPSLDPKRRPSSMGITFFVDTDEDNFRVCLTWGIYEEITDGGIVYYQRHPKGKILKVPMNGKDRVKISNDSFVYLNYSIETLDRSSNRKKISLYIVNNIEPQDRRKTEVKEAIFQPQIRIKLGKSTSLAKLNTKNSNNSEDAELALLYRHRDFSAKGHLCSVILKEFDPQILSDHYKNIYSAEALKSPAFKWIDGIVSADLTRSDINEFSEPDLRTEFVPMYSVPGPQYEIFDREGRSLTFLASDLAQAWNPEDLKKRLFPMIESFKEWIESNRDELAGRSGDEKIILSRLPDSATLSLNRMKKGLNLLLNDEKARLAFCLTNKAMDLQYGWNSNGKRLEWRPFQMAYFLLTIESIFNVNSDDRRTCDLLWVATGGGKTEAYLAIIAFTITLRRLRQLDGPDEGFGTSVITRYTLRLLAVQQFRRTLSLVTALEYLRVFKNGQNQIGWRPSGYTESKNPVLGSTPFTIGLWVGSGVTPNTLEGSDYTTEGAISKLKKASDPRSTSEPAQITTCPACHSVLSIPAEGLEKGTHILYLIFKSVKDKLQKGISTVTGVYGKITLNRIELKENSNKNYLTLRFEFETKNRLSIAEIESFLRNAINKMKKYDSSLAPASSHITRPGYFLRTYINRNQGAHEYNFEVYCPNPDCPLSSNWFAGSPAGLIHNRDVEEFLADRQTSLNTKLKLNDVIEPFQAGDIHYSDRVQIPAITVDDQIYMNPPSVLLSTVDKFARPAFEPRSSAIFGNFDFYHSIYGYYRENLHGRGVAIHPSPMGGKTPLYVKVEKAAPPDLILQDELHLIEGPLGGMVGIYETAIDYLIREGSGIIPKYIASTATIRNAEDQVKAIFTRKVHLFPPFGNNSDDRFFVKESEGHALEESLPGRLYIGIATPGRGPLTLIYRIWARLLQTGWENGDNPEVNRFWTVAGYFNSIRELAGAVALYRQDIPQQLRIIGHGDFRKIGEDGKVELSSRINSTELPTVLEKLNRDYVPGIGEPVDTLFTTSMFGTGIDVSRLGLMIVNGQPKTTSAYIQSTGRIGRSGGGMVITFLRVSRPRDLSHYEYFTGFHRQLHRFVEPVSAYPFAPRLVERAIGPVSVLILRNSRLKDIPWYLDEYAGKMSEFRQSSSIVGNLKDVFEARAQEQPDLKSPPPRDTENKTMEMFDTWEQENRRSRSSNKNVKYVEYYKAESDVVLGDPVHRRSKELTTVFDNAPQSLRDIEETTSFET